MAHPLLTVIMAAYNAERHIAESIDSVIAQTVSDWELIVVDDGSRDRTTKIVAGYTRVDSRIRLISQPANLGPAHARNLAIEQARGELMAFIDSDDIWFSEKTEKQLSEMQLLGADISYTSYIRRRHGHTTGVLVRAPERVTYRSMLRRNLIACSTAIVRRTTCGNLRMPHIRRRQDHGYWLALLRDGSRTAIGINEPLVLYRLHRHSLSANKLLAAKYSWKLLREVEGFDLATSIWLFSGYAFDALRLRLVSRRARPYLR